MRVVVGKRSWQGFVRRAKGSFPMEHCEALWGESTVDGFRITDIKHMKVTVEKNQVDYDDDEVQRHRAAAAKVGKTFLGTVHTHPGKSFDTCGSTHDHHVASKDGELLMGVVVLYKDPKGSKFVMQSDWWIPQPKIEVIYAED